MTAQQQAGGPSIGWRILALVGGLALVAGAVVLSASSPASATGLEAFASCEDLQSHLDEATEQLATTVSTAGAAVDASGAAEASELSAQRSSGDDSAAAEADGTNTQVTGVDELDTVEVLADGRILVARLDEVLLVSADGERVLARLPTSPGPRISYDDEQATLWAVSTDDWQSTVLLRAVLDGDAFRDAATWQVAGRLVDLRRVGGQVHLVLVDEDLSPLEPMPLPVPVPEPEPTTTTVVEPDPDVTTTTVVEPDPDVTTTTVVEPDPDVTTTTVVEPPVDDAGPAAQTDPERAAASASGDAVVDAGTASLPFAGTSPVSCDEVLHAPLPGGVATTLVATFGTEGELAPIAATEIVGAGDNVLVTDDAMYVSTPSYGPELVTGLHRFDLEGLEHTGSGSVPGRLLNQFSLDEHDGYLRAAVIAGEGAFGRPMAVEDVAVDVAVDSAPGEEVPTPEPPPSLNEVVVLDLAEDLDVVGRTPRFGKPGETLHGIRFVGDVAYAVTFLQTDPFYVIDLASPASPRVLGELEIPGFSAYLHPVDDDRVVGFGPGEDGRATARLFDTSDPTAPAVVDTATLADESPVVDDHHALRVDGDRLLLPATTYGATVQGRIVTLTPTGDRLGMVAIDTDVPDAQRVIPLADGYLVVGYDRVTKVGPDGTSGVTVA